MVCNEKVLVICGKWSDIYEWGGGFTSSEKAEGWRDFWNKFETIKDEYGIGYWNYGVDSSFNTPYLFSTYGCVYMHPMDFTAYLIISDNNNSYDGVVESLNKICKLIAEWCDSEFHMILEEVPFKHNLCINSMNGANLGYKVIS